MKKYKLINQDGKELIASAFDIGNGLFIIGQERKKGTILCNTLPITKKIIETVYNLKLEVN